MPPTLATIPAAEEEGEVGYARVSNNGQKARIRATFATFWAAAPVPQHLAFLPTLF